MKRELRGGRGASFRPGAPLPIMTGSMAFGWSFPKLMVLISVTFILFGVPLMAFILALRERRRKKKESGDG